MDGILVICYRVFITENEAYYSRHSFLLFNTRTFLLNFVYSVFMTIYAIIVSVDTIKMRLRNFEKKNRND